MLLLENSKSFEKTFVRAQRALDGGRAGRADGVVPLRAPAPLGRRLAEARRHEALLLEPVQGRVERAGRGAPPGAAPDLVADRDAVRVVAEAQDREQDDLLELAEVVAAAH